MARCDRMEERNANVDRDNDARNARLKVQLKCEISSSISARKELRNRGKRQK